MESKTGMYSLVRFLNDDSISAVPSIWVERVEGMVVCSWPGKNMKNIRNVIVQALPSKPEWERFEVKIVKTYETYEDAFKKEKHLSSDSEQELGKGLQKKVRSKKYPSDNEDELPILIEVSEPQNDMLTSELVGEHVLEEQNEILQSPVNSVPSPAPLSSTGSLEDIHEDIVQIKLTLKIIQQQLMELGNRMGGMQVHLSVSVKLPSFPFQSTKDLVNFEEDLSDTQVAQHFLQKVSLIGGYNFKNCVSRTLQSIFSNELGTFCSWTGKGKEVIKIIKRK